MKKGLTGANLALLLVLAAIWGTAFMFITLGLVDQPDHPASFSPLLFAALRFDVAGVVILAVALLRKSPLWPTSRAQWLAIGLAATLQVGAYHALLFLGQPYLDESVAAIVVALNPILTTAASRAFLTDERLGVAGLVGLASGLLGVVILTIASTQVFNFAILGMALTFAAVLSWSVSSVLVRRTRHGMDVFAFTAWQMLVGAVLLHVSSLVFETPRGTARAVFDTEGVVSLGYLALISSAIGFLLYYTLLERVGPIRSNLVSNIAPIFATLAGIVVLHSPFHPLFLVAFLCIAGGFLLVARPTIPTPKQGPAP